MYGTIGAVAAVAALGATGFALLDSGSEQPDLYAEPVRISGPESVGPASTETEPEEIDDRSAIRRLDESPPSEAASEPVSTTPTVSEQQTQAVSPIDSDTDSGSDDETVESIGAVRPEPFAVATDRIDLSPYRVRPIGLEANGELEIPDETEIGWYELGAAPGEAGATVLAAHVSWNRQLGPFAHLATMEPGDLVTTASLDGSVNDYVVVERAMYPKTELPNERIWRNVGDEALVLITCGGSFDDTINRYRDNIVVYAVPVDTPDTSS